MVSDSELTQLFVCWKSGDKSAVDRLMPLVYQQLKHMASRAMSQESQQHTLQTTALVHELYLKLKKQSVDIENRKQFYGFCATVIRNMLIDHARGKNRDKRWGQFQQVTLNITEKVYECNDDFIALDAAILRLKEIDLEQHQYLVLHYYAGLSYAEVADVSSVSRAQVGRELKMAKAWLSKQLVNVD